MCARRGEEPGKARKVVHEGRPKEQAFSRQRPDGLHEHVAHSATKDVLI